MSKGWQWVLRIGVSLCLGMLIWVGGGSLTWGQPALPVVQMDLPQPALPVLDLADQLTQNQEAQLVQQLTKLEQDTGWKLRVLTQFDQTPGRQVKDYWGLNERSVLMVADPRGGNLLAFNVGDAVREILPRTFWIELQSRFGNQFYVREHGSHRAIMETVNTLDRCFHQGGCRVVPGLPQEQWILTLITSILGGFVFGFAGKPRHAEELFNWRWALLISPLWFILFGAFGIGPVVTRTTDWVPLLRNVMGFAAGALLIYLVPISRPVQDPQ
ncbi:MAG: TPM domain-containing protein [Thermostichus sp. DG_1_6_bins_120]